VIERTNAMRLSTTALCLAALLVSPAADAALIDEGEWTLDTDTGIEWLSLPLTAGLSYDSVLAGADGWTNSGWQFATLEQFITLGSEYIAPQGANGIYGADDTFGVIQSEAAADAAFTLVTDLGVTNSYGAAGAQSIGFFAGGATAYLGNIIAEYAGQNVIGADYAQSAGIWEYGPLQPSELASYTGPGVGSFLIRGGETPEPSTWAMMLIGFAGLGFAGYRRAKRNSAAFAD
jgi:hypothetical protein